MFNNKYGDEGFTFLFKEEISKDSEKLDFLGDLKEVKAYIKLCINFINPFTYYFINETLTEILNVLDKIEKDYIENTKDHYEVKSVVELEKSIQELNTKLDGYRKKDLIDNKISALAELIYTKCLKLERSYYKLKKEQKYQSYLNRINDYFYLLSEYASKEM